jgi:hypothetical protein
MSPLKIDRLARHLGLGFHLNSVVSITSKFPCIIPQYSMLDWAGGKSMADDQLDDLRKEISEIRDRYPQLSLDNAFVTWFIRAFIVEDEKSAVEALKGGPKDKGVDAIYIDHESLMVYVVQGKYHQAPKVALEKRSDVIALADLGRAILDEDRGAFNSLLNDADTNVRDILEKAYKVLHNRKYKLRLQFVTTGKVSKTHKGEAEQRVENWQNASFDVFDRSYLLRLMKDYIEGASPPLPTISLPVYQDELFNWFDKDNAISSWVFSMIGQDIGKLYKDNGVRLFARNIRGFLGKVDVNKSIARTLKDEPQYFWYFNNGVTIISDEAKQITESGHTYLRVTNPQIINGQQTVRVLSENPTSKATVLVKVIDVPRESEVGHERYNYVLDQIVKATNWQNAISQIDLKSNDAQQVRLEREFRKFGYQYIRKKQTRSEARRLSGGRCRIFVKKEDLAQAVSACILDPFEVRLGKRNLFGDDLYGKIFSDRPAAEYLVFYWLVQEVSSHSRGKPTRGYAKWYVVNFMWHEIGVSLIRPELRENFIHVCERENRYPKMLNQLGGAIDGTFNSAMAFFRANRRSKKGEILDVSDFFKQYGLHQDFVKFFSSSKNPRRKDVENRLHSFIEELAKVKR